jgi:hypothetical protein
MNRRFDPSGAQAIPVKVPDTVIQGASVKFAVSTTAARDPRETHRPSSAPKSAIQREGLMVPNIGQLRAQG